MVYNNIDELALLLKSISHPIRLKILCLLQNNEMSVSEIRESVETSGANITQHLNILRNQGVIDFRKDANFIYNRIADDRIIELMKTMQTLFCANSSSSNSQKSSVEHSDLSQ
jgi:ArsR family transcriptional regulator